LMCRCSMHLVESPCTISQVWLNFFLFSLLVPPQKKWTSLKFNPTNDNFFVIRRFHQNSHSNAQKWISGSFIATMMTTCTSLIGRRSQQSVWSADTGFCL
jgi:hypothetical protein